MLCDTRERYGSVSRFFHWLMAVLLIWQFLRFGQRIAEGEHWVGQTLVPWHVSIGATLLVLIVLRARHRGAVGVAAGRIAFADCGVLRRML